MPPPVTSTAARPLRQAAVLAWLAPLTLAVAWADEPPFTETIEAGPAVLRLPAPSAALDVTPIRLDEAQTDAPPPAATAVMAAATSADVPGAAISREVTP